MWPASGMRTRRAPGIAARNCSATESGERTSSSPQISRVGDRDPRQQVALVASRDRDRGPPHAFRARLGHDRGERVGYRRRRVGPQQPRQGRLELLWRQFRLLDRVGEPLVALRLGQRSLPPGVGIGQDQRGHPIRIATVQLERHDASPGEAADVGGVEPERADQARHGIGVVREGEVRRRIGRSARAGLVPGDHREPVGEALELWVPHPAVGHRAVQQHQRRPRSGPLVGDFQAGDVDASAHRGPG